MKLICWNEGCLGATRSNANRTGETSSGIIPPEQTPKPDYIPIQHESSDIILTHWGLDKTAAILEMTFSRDENLDENCCYFDLNLTEACFSGFNKQYAIIGSDNGLVPMRQQAINWTNDGLVHWHIYASPDLNNIAVIKSPSSLRHIVQFLKNITVDLQNTHNGHQYLTCSNKIWDAFCESKFKSIFCFVIAVMYTT